MQLDRAGDPSFRFAAFDVDVAAGELRKNGLRIPLQEQPFRVLLVLLENPGRIVTREELQQKLWPADTFVEFDRGLNTAINKVREALNDSAVSPRFVETVPKRGYRFLAPVERVIAGDGGEPRGLGTERNPLGPWPSVRKNALSIALLAAVAVLIWRGLRPRQVLPDPPLRKFSFTSEDATDSGLATYGRATISPDGRQIAYFGGRSTSRRLWVWSLDRDEHRPYIEFAPGVGPLQKYGYSFWSPDGQSIGFLTASEVKISAGGGAATPVCAQRGYSRGAAWSPNGNSILMTDGVLTGDAFLRLYEVSSRGGEPKLLVQPRESEKGKDFLTPSFPPEGNNSHVLLFSVNEAKPEIMLEDLNTGQEAAVIEGAWPAYSPSGHIIYQRSLFGNGIWALPFSMKSMKRTGEPFRVAENGSYPSVAGDGTLVYLEEFPRSKILVWRNRQGVKSGEIGQPQKDMFLPSLSPNGRWVGVEGIEASTGEDVWIHDTAAGAKTRVTLDPARDTRAIWSPDGKEIAFASNRNGAFQIFITSSEAGGKSKPLLAGGKPVAGFPDDWSSDGQYIVYSSYGDRLSILKRNAQGGWDAPLVSPGAVYEGAGRFSPDGRFLAYCSNESGRFEVYVRSFPDGERKWPVSQLGGSQPRWRKDSTELYYVRGDTLIAVKVTLKPSFAVGAEVALFSNPALDWEYHHPTYDVSPDGQRFVLIEPQGALRKASIRVVQNWFAEFRDRKGAGNN